MPNHKQSLVSILKPLLASASLYSSPEAHHRQSSVAVILKNSRDPSIRSQDRYEILEQRISYFLQTEILLLQRVVNNRPFSGDVCLPGGKIDKGETPLQAAFRQTKEETDIDLKEEQLLGVGKSCFTANEYTGKGLNIYAYVFFLDRQTKVRVNLSEMSNFRWVPLKQLLVETSIKPLKVGFRVPYADQKQYKELGKYISHLQYPSMEVGLGKELYGLTLYILGYFANSLLRPIMSLYSRLCVIEGKIMNNSYSIGQDKRHVFFRVKMLLEMCFCSTITFKNIYFKNWNLVFTADCPYTPEEMAHATDVFRQRLQSYFPIRPRF